MGFVLWILFNLHGIAWAQTSGTKLTWGPEISDHRGDEIIQVFDGRGSFFHVLRLEGKRRQEFLLERIGIDSLDQIKTLSFILPEVKEMSPLLAYVISLKSKDYIIATAEDPKSSDFYVLAYELLDNLEISPTPITLGISNRNAVVNDSGFLLELNEEKNAFALLLPTEEEESRNQKYELRFYDENLNLQLSKKLEIPYPSRFARIESILLGGNSKLHAILSIDENQDEKTSAGFYGIEFSLLSYDMVEGSIREKSLSLGNKWLYDLRMTSRTDTTLNLVGFYSNMVTLSMAGTFSVELDTRTGQVLQQGLSPFSREFRSQFRSSIRKGETELGQFELDYIYPKEDKVLQLVCEKRYKETSTQFNPVTGTYSIIEIFNYDEILLTGMDPSSNIVYNVLIPKYQSSSRVPGRYTSYISLEQNGVTYFIFNEHTKNVSIPMEQQADYKNLNTLGNATPVLIKFDQDEKITRERLPFSQFPGYTLDAHFFLERPDYIVLMAFDGYKIRYLKLRLE